MKIKFLLPFIFMINITLEDKDVYYQNPLVNNQIAKVDNIKSAYDL